MKGVNVRVGRDRFQAKKNRSHGKLTANENEVWGMTWLLPVSLPRASEGGGSSHRQVRGLGGNDIVSYGAPVMTQPGLSPGSPWSHRM